MSPVDLHERTNEIASTPMNPPNRMADSISSGSSHEHASILKRMTASGSHHSRSSILQLQRSHGNRYVQRALALARQADAEGEVTPEVESAIEGARGGGQGLDHSVRRQMESAFGADFGGVRIHTGAEAHSLNRAVSAIAFTTGQDIFFRDGAYSPETTGGKELLAHELTHVVQQCRGRVRCKFVLGEPGNQSEQEADRVGNAVVRGLEAGPTAARVGSVQKNCGCGGETVTGEECAECRAKRLAMSRIARNHATSNSTQSGKSATTLDAGVDDDSPFATMTGFDFGVSAASASRPIQLQDDDGGDGGQQDGGGGGMETVTACTPTAKFTSIPSGKLSATTGSGKFGASFNMNAQFTTPIPCTCVSGEYRQFVRGFFKVNGVAQTHALCSNTMDTSTWNEDCATIGGTDYKYGYHSIPFATSKFTDPDQATGCTFNGFDFPGFKFSAFSSGDKLEMHLEFQGKLVDASSGDAQLAASSWTVEGSTTVP
jgi:hypothetical protein